MSARSPAGSPGRVGRATVVLLVLGVLAAAALAWERVSARLNSPPTPRLSSQVAAPAPLNDVLQDQGNGVPLPDGRHLWLFADTINTRSPAFFTTSSAGVTSDRGLTLRYLSRDGRVPVEFLPRTAAERAATEQNERYLAVWPTGATTLPDGRILIAYAKYEVIKEPLDFRFIATGLYEYRWDPRHLVTAEPARRIADDLWGPDDGAVAVPVYHRGYVYFSQCADYRCWSLRTTPDRVTDRDSYRWWTGSGWSGDRADREQMEFGSDVPGRNPPVVRDPRSGLFVMVDTTGGIQDRSGRFWVARNPWGPWSDAASFPLPQCPAEGCYTLNVHPTESPPGTLRVSFATSGLGPYVRVVDVPVRLDRLRVSVTTGGNRPVPGS